MQWSDRRNRNSTTTTLPLKLESCTSLPPPSKNFSSGDCRGTGAVACSGMIEIVSKKKTFANFFMVITPPISLCSSEMVPLVDNSLNFSSGGACSSLRGLLAFKNASDHPGNKRTVEDLHKCWRSKSGNAQIRGPMQSILKLCVFPCRIGLWVFRQTDNDVRNSFGIDWEVTALGLLVTRPGAVDQIAHEFLCSFPILGKVPDR